MITIQHVDIMDLFDNGEGLDNIIKAFTNDVIEQLKKSLLQLEESFDFTIIEREFNELFNLFSANLLAPLLNKVLRSKDFLILLKKLGGKKGMRYVRYTPITIRLYNGKSVKVFSPYFAKAQPKKGRKRKKSGPRGKHGEGHLGLTVFGFIGLCSGNFASEVVKLAVLCPSIQIAKEILSERDIFVNTKTIRRVCKCIGQIGLTYRGSISLSGKENLNGLTLVIGIDGGRLRVRKTKRGKKKKDQIRQGYYTDWKEPMLFTLYLEDENGDIVKEFSPIHDATMTKISGMFDLLEEYLSSLNISNSVAKIVFCGDGDPNIWNGVEALITRIYSEVPIYQVLDYTHAKQNLNYIIKLISKKVKNKKKIIKEWKNLLWTGDIKGLYDSIKSTLKGKNKKAGIKKLENYFIKNEKRMQYEQFRNLNIPCGSGCVESAIRRVINLRLKSPGIFWKKEMAEIFLFLRSQLISGRWLIFIRNVVRRYVYHITLNGNDNTIKLKTSKHNYAL